MDSSSASTVAQHHLSSSAQIQEDSNSLEKAHPRWTNMWNDGLAPGDAFDARVPCPALMNEMKEGRVPNGKALVPGCGRGYDVWALASPERSVIGIDLAEKAVEAARALNDECAAPEQASFILGNFFDLPTTSVGTYDFIYDYTFLCALDPSIRNEWAKQMAALVKPGGLLITLVFPICDKDGGPPFAMSLEIVRALLMDSEQQGQWKCEQLELLPSELCHSGRDGSSGGFMREGMKGPGAASGIGRWRRL